MGQASSLASSYRSTLFWLTGLPAGEIDRSGGPCPPASRTRGIARGARRGCRRGRCRPDPIRGRSCRQSPAVLILHGTRGVELNHRAYERYANALAAAGIDTYFARYLTSADKRAFDPKTSTRESRAAYDMGRYEGWTRRVSSVVTAILARPESSGRIGLLGFSTGGFLAAATGALDAP